MDSPQKAIILNDVLAAIPDTPCILSKVIPEVRLKISQLGGRVVEDTEMLGVFARMKQYHLVSFDETHIRRLVPVWSTVSMDLSDLIKTATGTRGTRGGI